MPIAGQSDRKSLAFVFTARARQAATPCWIALLIPGSLAWAEGITLKASALKLGDLTEAEFDKRVVPGDMIGPKG